MKNRFHQIELFMNHPSDVQNALLHALLYQAKDTQFGLDHDFKNISSYQKFKNNIPIRTYEDFEPYIEKARRGEKDVTWPGKIKWFAKSSGTTNAKSKFIPISENSLNDCHYQAGKDLLCIYTNNYPDTQIFSGKNLRIGGSSQLHQDYETTYGDLSAILIDNLPFWAEMMNRPNKQISMMHEWETKLEAIADNVLNENITTLMGVPSWTMVLLNRVLEKSNVTHLDHLWPHLEVFFHGGINFKPYESNYQNLFEKKINYLEIYNASEGFFGAQDQTDSKDMLLMLDYGIFYEFIPMNLFDQKIYDAISLDEVELNKNYAMVISTNGGLWRYLIGDTIRFTSITPYRVIITGRTKHYINAFGEELIIENAEEALKIASKKANATIKDFTAGPIFMDNKKSGAHEWLIDFERHPDSLAHFTQILDMELQKLNSDYEAKRYNNMTLSIPVVRIARTNLFYDWLKEKGKLGGQNKVPRLANDRRFLDELLVLNK